MRHVVEQSAVEHRKVDDPLDADLARKIECHERLGHLVGHRGIEQEQRVNALQHRRIDATSVMSAWTGSTPVGTLTLDASSRTSADPLTLPGEPLHDLRSDGSGATCDENAHRPAPCYKPKTVVDDVANKCGLETGLDGKRAFHIRNAE
jgi:hypothetical protein